MVRMTRDEGLRFVAMVLAWQDGAGCKGIRAAATDTLWLDAAQECLDDFVECAVWGVEP